MPRRSGKRAETLLELMYQIEYFTLARAWEGLTDEEFFWDLRDIDLLGGTRTMASGPMTTSSK
jgi:hypothetical protein